VDLLLQALKKLGVIDFVESLSSLGFLLIEFSWFDFDFLEVQIEGHNVVASENRIVDDG